MATLEPSRLGNWATTTPEDAVSWFSSLTVPWWVAGGWALDLFLGQQFREHGDFDVGVLRRDSPQLLAALWNWEIFEAQNGALSQLRYGVAPRQEVNSLWCRPAGSMLWSAEVLLDTGDTEFWVFRREPRIRRPLNETIRRTPQGLPYLAPEVQLLYKARAPRPRDQDDFANVLPRLDASARKWLQESRLATTCNHRWLSGRRHQRPRRISSALSHSGSCTRSIKRHLSPQLPHTTDLPLGSARPLRVCLNSLTSDSCSVCWQTLMRRLSRPDGLVTVSVQRVSWLVVAVSMCVNTIGPGAWLTGAKGHQYHRNYVCRSLPSVAGRAVV